MALALALLSLFQYAGSLHNDFIWDARDTFLNDPSIREAGHWRDYFSEGMFARVDMVGERFAYLDYYRPLVKILHRLEFQLFGEDPTGYNAVNIALNVLVVVAAFFVVRAFTQNAWLAFAAVALYAVNPSRVEAVSWSYSDSYLLFSLFSLLALLAFHRRRMLLALLAFTLALLSQESAIVLPLVLGLYQWLLRGDRHWRDYLPLLAFVALALGFLLLRAAAVGSAPLTELGPLSLLNAVVAIVAASVRAFFVPQAGVSIYHYTAGMFDEPGPWMALRYAVAAGLLALGVWLWRRRPADLFWFLWFFVWMAVIFNVGKYAEYYFMDKIMFLGALGFCVLLARLLLQGPLSLRAGVAVLGMVLVAHFATTLWRSGFYLDEQRYFEQAVQSAPDFALAQYALGSLYREQGDYGRALQAFRRTVEIDPGHSFAWNNLGNIHFMRNEFAQAVAAWQKAIASDPDNPQPYYNVGVGLERLGRRQEALRYYRQYLDREPQPPAQVRNYIRRLEARRP